MAFLGSITELPYLSPWLLLLVAGLIFTIIYHQAHQPFQRIGYSWFFSSLCGPWGMPFTTDTHLQTGYDKIIKMSHRPFIMRWWGLDYIFLSPKYLPDIRKADGHRLSFFQSLNDAFSLDAMFGNLYSSNLMVDVVKRGLNPRLATIVPLLDSEATYVIAQEIGSPKEWTSFPASQLCSRIMHRVTSCILIGPEICHDEIFLETSQALGEATFKTAFICSMLPPLGLFKSPVRRLISRLLHQPFLDRAMGVILPVVQARFDEFQVSRTDQTNIETEKDEHIDAIQWTLSLTSTTYPTEHTPKRIALVLLQNLWASNAGPAELLTQMIFQILHDPIYLPPLRAEIESALATHGSPSEKALSPSSTPLLDSFLREINRLYPTDAVTCSRTVTDPQGFILHDGTRLPPGSRIAVPTLAIQTDVENYHDPMRFDGWRFARLRDTKQDVAGEAEAKYGAATVSDTYLPFGIGRHSCPGRWYAVLMIKLVFAKLILEYDFKWNLNEGVIQKVRPASSSLNGMFVPNQEQKVWLRKRQNL
ncbi:Cytochrome P450 [Naviculisporaceae sp. PSN 640]